MIDPCRIPVESVMADVGNGTLGTLALSRLRSSNASMPTTQRRRAPGLVVAMRFFLGLSVPEVPDVSPGTVDGDRRIARAWLRGPPGEAAP